MQNYNLKFKIFQNTKIQLLIIALLTILIYSNTFQNGFVIEDEVYITKWELTQSLGNIPKMFAGDTAPTGNWGIYRPLRGVFYAISYQLWGNNPTPYHIQALLVHLTATLLVYFIAREIIQGLGVRVWGLGLKIKATEKLSIPYTLYPIPLIVALLFGLHPVHTEAVDYLTASFDAVAYIFFFGSFYFYLKIKKYNNYNCYKDYNYYISIALATAAFFYFEMTLTLPFLLLLYDLLFRKKFFKKLENILIIHSPYFLLAGVYLFIRMVLLNMTVRGEYLGGSIYYTALTMLKVISKYLEWLVFPLNLSINPVLPGGISAWNHPLSHPERVVQQSLFDLPVLISIIVISTLIFIAFYFYRKFPLVSFSIGWFFISILPILYIIPQGTIFQERYIYIASFGYILCSVFLGFYFYEKNFPKIKNYTKDWLPAVRAIILTILVVTVVFYGFRAYTRNKDWKDSFAVWSTLAKTSPEDVIANFYTANLYAGKGIDDMAIKHYNQVLALEYKLHEAHYALGKIYQKQGNSDLAATKYYQSLAINPNFTPALEGVDLINLEATSGATLDREKIWKTCTLGKTFTFSCPTTWKIFNNQKTRTTVLKDPKAEITIEMILDTPQKARLPDGQAQTLEDYMASQKETYGTLINQGLANFLNFDTAFVKVWDDPAPSGAGQKLQFFLFKNGNVIKVLVYPANSQLMGKFERLVSSIRLLGQNSN